MYDAAPVRPRKTSIVRSRSGCETCRKRRRKVCLPTCMFNIEMFLSLTWIHQCDEAKPSCSLCHKNNKPCHYNALTLEFRDASAWAADKVRKIKRDPNIPKCWGSTKCETTEPCPNSTSHANYLSRRLSLPVLLARTPSDAILCVSTVHTGHKSSKSLEERRPFTSTSGKSAFATLSEPSLMLENDDLYRMQQWHHEPSSGDLLPFEFNEELSGASLIEIAPSCTGAGMPAQSVTCLSSSAGTSPCYSHGLSSFPTGRWHKICT
jgi:hypothetical protein